jgi:hypothetical protein
MSNPATYRDSTQIVLPCRSLDGIRERMEAEFTVTVFSKGGRCRIIGSPVVIKDVSDFLVRQGIPLN